MPTKSLSNADMGHQGLTLESMLQNTRLCGSMIVNPEGAIIGLTPEAERILRVRQSPDLSVRKLPSAVQLAIDESQNTGKIISNRKIALHSNGANASIVTITTMPVTMGQSIPGVVAVLEEISPAKKIEQNLRRLDQLASVGTLSASMAHEIKNAFVAIRTFVDLLLEKNPDAEFVGVVRRELGRVDSIVSHMLNFATPAQPEFSSIRLHDILDHSLRLVQYRIEGKKISFRREFNAGTDSFSGDDREMEQAFVNLMFNAVDAMKAGGTLSVSTEWISRNPAHQSLVQPAQSEMLQVRISDTGDGILPENLAHIFEPFFTTKETGTGLGLAVTRRIIEEHSGEIQVESSPGNGTTFVILLPALLPAAAPPVA
jgi:signal transduction histidine kinase